MGPSSSLQIPTMYLLELEEVLSIRQQLVSGEEGFFVCVSVLLPVIIICP